MRITAQYIRLGEGEWHDKESVCNSNDVEKHIEEWVEWLRNQLKEAASAGEDVEILLGRKPNMNHTDSYIG